MTRLFPEAVRRTRHGANREETHRTGNDPVLTESSLVREVSEKAPRAGRHSHRAFVELGSFAVSRLRPAPIFTLFAWNAPPSPRVSRLEPDKPGPDPLRLARYYQSLLDSGKFESRAALARFIGVSRARMTQVLNRLESPAGIIPRTAESRPETAAG